MQTPVSDLTRADLQVMLDQASKTGAKMALHDIGLHDEEAAEDIKQLRGLLDSWRDAKKTAWKTFIDWLTKLFLGALLLGLYVKNGGKGL